MSAPSVACEPVAARTRRGTECRVYERHSCELATTCQPIAARSDKDIVWPAIIRDVSEGGLGVVLGRRFERGAGLAIELPGTGDRPSETLLAKVVHATALPGKRWLLGCSLISRLSEDEVRLVVALAAKLKGPAPEAKPSTPSPDRGKGESPAPSTGHDRPAPVITNLWFEGAAQDGQLVRVPVRRLILTGAWPLAAGTVLRLWVGDKNTHPGGTRVKVVQCRQEDGVWIVTYQPFESLSVETLGSLGFAG